MTKPCECPMAGWCQRHKMDKVGRLYELCQTDERYRELWDKQTNKEPGLLQKAKNFIGAAIDHAKDGFRETSPETLKIRLETCDSCPEKDLAFGQPKCKACGCFLNIKTKWASSKCPLDKWGPENKDKNENST